MVNDAKRGPLTLNIYNARGQLIRSIIIYPDKAGEYIFRWDGRDAAGRTVASGVYLCRIGVTGFSQTARVVLIK